MAFDLNKNDGADKVPSNKQYSASKFDLSKSDEPTPLRTPPAPTSNKWIIGLVGIVIIAGGIWFYSSRDEKSNVATSSVAEVIPADSTRTATADTAGTSQPAMVEKETVNATSQTIAEQPGDKNIGAEAASLSNKSVASYVQGSSAISQLDQPLLKRIVSYLKKNPDAAINILGYASSDGSLAVNQTVSQGRADAFKDLLVKKEIAGSRISAIGKGIENPIASNATNAGRSKNRRIEINFQ